MYHFAPEGFSEEKISIMRALGAEIHRTPQAEGMLGARQWAESYADETGAFIRISLKRAIIQQRTVIH